MTNWIKPSLLRRLPLDSSWFGPPRRDAPFVRYPHKDLVRLVTSVDMPVAEAEAPVCLGTVSESFRHAPASAQHRIDVFTITGGRVLGPDAHIVAPGDYLLHDPAWRHGPNSPALPGSRSPTFRRRRAYPRHVLPGRTFLLGSDWSVGSYAHFLTDALGRWIACRQTCPETTGVDRVLAYGPRTEASARILAAAVPPGLPIVHADPRADYACETLVATGFPHPVPEYSRPILEAIQALLPPRAPGRLVYLSRQGFARHPGNADELERLLAARGFETVAPDDHLGAIEACREARVVVGCEGSNLFNTVFSPPGARVIVLLGPGISLPYIPAIGRALSHATTVIGAISPDEPASPRFLPEHLAAAIDRALSSSLP